MPVNYNRGIVQRFALSTSLALLAALMASVVTFAQRPLNPESAPTFEAATVKPNKSGGGPYASLLPGRLRLTFYSVQELVAFAYGVRPEQVVGKATTDRYDIEATTDGKTPIGQMAGPMLQALLKDRFRLILHHELRQLPVFELAIAKSGIRMPTTKGDCAPSAPEAAPKPAPGESRTVFVCDHPRTGAKGLTRTLEGRGVSMTALAESLSRTELNRTVLNKTGLTQAFDVSLRWAVDPSVPGLDDDKGGARTKAENAEPSIFTALQEQLGLKLETSQGPVDVLVIDRSERPSQN
jgi:uncharacterized protein (TIGR03435 family)